MLQEAYAKTSVNPSHPHGCQFGFQSSYTYSRCVRVSCRIQRTVRTHNKSANPRAVAFRIFLQFFATFRSLIPPSAACLVEIGNFCCILRLSATISATISATFRNILWCFAALVQFSAACFSTFWRYIQFWLLFATFCGYVQPFPYFCSFFTKHSSVHLCLILLADWGIFCINLQGFATFSSFPLLSAPTPAFNNIIMIIMIIMINSLISVSAVRADAPIRNFASTVLMHTHTDTPARMLFVYTRMHWYECTTGTAAFSTAYTSEHGTYI